MITSKFAFEFQKKIFFLISFFIILKEDSQLNSIINHLVIQWHACYIDLRTLLTTFQLNHVENTNYFFILLAVVSIKKKKLFLTAHIRLRIPLIFFKKHVLTALEIILFICINY